MQLLRSQAGVLLGSVHSRLGDLSCCVPCLQGQGPRAVFTITGRTSPASRVWAPRDDASRVWLARHLLGGFDWSGDSRKQTDP